MPGIGQDLQAKAGPLPVWAWAGLGTVGIAGYLIYRKKQSMTQAANQATTNTTSSSVPGGPSNLTTQAEPMPINTGDTFVNVTSNDTDTSTAHTFQNPDSHNRGESPGTPAPARATTRVATATPPSASLSEAPKPPSASPAPKPANRTVTVGKWPSWNGSLFGIAKHFYGNGEEWPKIFEANKGQIANPNLIYPGQVLVVP